MIELLRPALGERPIYTLQDVEKEIAEGRSFLWAGERSAIAVSVNDHSTGERSLDAWLAGGDLREILSAVQPIENWARTAGCTQIHVNGREGWARVLASRGYRPWTYTLRKLLDGQ